MFKIYDHYIISNYRSIHENNNFLINFYLMLISILKSIGRVLKLLYLSIKKRSSKVYIYFTEVIIGIEIINVIFRK